MPATPYLPIVLVCYWVMGLGYETGGPLPNAPFPAGNTQSLPPAPPVPPAAEPPPPAPSAAVQPLLAAAAHLTQNGKPQEALRAGDQALAVARQAQDTNGEALSAAARARALEGLGQPDEAMAAWREAAAAWKRAGDGPGQVEALVAAGLLRVAQHPEEAQALIAAAATLAQAERRRPLAGAQALHVAGRALYARGYLELARTVYATAVALREARIPDARETAASLNNLGLLLGNLGELAEADRLLRRSLAIEEHWVPHSTDVADSLRNLGTVAWQRGDLDAAETYHRRALALYEELAPHSLELASGLHNVGVVLYGRGDLAAAEEHLRRALALQRELAPRSLATASSLNNIGNVAFARGDLPAAREAYAQALALREELAPQSLAVAESRHNLGGLARQQGDLAAAQVYSERALALFLTLAPNSAEVASVLANLGNVAYEQGRLPAAWEQYQQALAIQERLTGRSLLVARLLGNLGNVASARGDLTRAEDLQRRALALQEELAPSSLEVAGSLQSLGAVLHTQGKLAQAKALYRQALELARKLAPGSLDEAAILDNLGLVAELERNWSEAAQRGQAAWDRVRRQATAISGDEARRAFGASTAKYAVHLLRAQIALGKREAAFRTLEEGRVQALRQLLAERGLETSDAARPLRAAYQAAVTARDQAEQQVSEASSRETRSRRQLAAAREQQASPDEIRGVETAAETTSRQFQEAQAAYVLSRIRADRAWAEIVRHSPRAFAPAVSLPEARRLLPPGTLFVAFAVDARRIDLFLLEGPPEPLPRMRARPLPTSRPRAPGSADRLTLCSAAVDVRELREQIKTLRAQLTDPEGDAQAARALGRALFVRLFPPAAQQAMQRARRLLLSPDDLLWEVPFAALIANPTGPPRYLGLERPITFTPSLTLFAQARRSAPPARGGDRLEVLALGDPLFDRQPSQPAGTLVASALPGGAGPTSDKRAWSERSFLLRDGQPPAPLPGTAKEATTVARIYGGEPLLKEQATEAALRERIERARVVHLATHAYLHPYRAMSSGVLLTPPPPGADENSANDGALQAWEIYSQLRLHAELVVLSACETGKGENVAGEGIVGLTRALQYAGARAIVASQWQVADESTRALMVLFHRKLREGFPKDEALREAMAAVQREPKTSHPYYWAPFFLTGDPRAAR